MHQRIRELRMEHHMTQRQVAAALGCTRSAYSKYERGVGRIPLKILYGLACLYDTSIDYLSGLTDSRQRH